MVPDKDVPHNMGKKDVIRASDFNFLQVLGKGSFGKVSNHNSNIIIHGLLLMG